MTTKITPLEWPFRDSIFLTLDFECDFGTALSENYFEAVDYVSELRQSLEQFDVPLTCFVQTELLEDRPEAVETLRNANVPVRFHPHSHSHKRRENSSIPREYFDESPTGYRFPNGNIKDGDFQLLSRHGYSFDASVFPSWRLGHFNNTHEPTIPSYRENFDLYELPFTVFSDRIRVPTTLSYCQVIGRPYTHALLRNPPSVIILNIHMHDLVKPSTISELPLHYRFLYSRNPNGLSLLNQLLTTFQQKDYKFKTLDDAFENLRYQRD